MSIPKQFVFVLMPFDPGFDDVYKLGIRAACADAGAYCERVDEQIFHESILDRVYNQIAKADLLIADMTGRNPNVFYEVGYAHALGRRVILLTQNADDIPFDLKHYPHLVYGQSISKLKDELTKRVKWAIEHPEVPLDSAEPRVALFVKGREVATGAELVVIQSGYGFRLSVQIHNPSARVISGADLRLALVTPPGVSGGGSHQVIPLPDHQRLHQFPLVSELFPGGWDSVAVELAIAEPQRSHLTKDGLSATLQLVTRVGIRDFPVTLRLK